MLTPEAEEEARRIYVSAEDAYLAAHLLAEHSMGTHPRNPRFLGPHMVLSAFAAELLLKCLIVLHGGNVPSEHNLEYLFSQLPRLVKPKLVKRYESHPDMITSRERGLRNGFAPETFLLGQLLKHCGDYFERWRYRHEAKGGELSINNFQLFSVVLHDFILELRPDWKDKDESYFRSTFPAR